MERVAPGAARYLRVVESPEKRFWTPSAWLGQGQEAPAMDWHDFNNKRIIGTVPLEPDGSAYFAVPADRFIYLQLLDENGMMIQSMRSGTIVRPGEMLGCAGCHESRLASAPNRDVAAMHAPPRRLQPWYGPERELSYVTEVQPVWDRYCVRCHDYGQPAAEKLNLAGDLGLSFCVSYTELWRKGLVGAIGAGPAETQPPYSWGSHTSRLVKTLRAGHYGVELDRESWDRVVTWIDVNGPYYPTYASAYMDNLYGRCPLSNAELARLKELTGVDLLDGDNQQVEETWVSFTRPEISPLLAHAGAEGDPKREEALAIISAGAKRLEERPRGDRSGMSLDGLELARERKYEERAAREREAREAALSGRKVYPYRPG
jgi:hypothetical protein